MYKYAEIQKAKLGHPGKCACMIFCYISNDVKTLSSSSLTVRVGDRVYYGTPQLLLS